MPEDESPESRGQTGDFPRDFEIGFIVHELKDPLAVIETGLRSLLERQESYGPLSERQEKTLRRLLRSTLRGRSLVEDLMEMRRAKAGQVASDTFEPARVLYQTLWDAVETVESDALTGIDACRTDREALALFARRGIVLETEASLEPIEIRLDEKKFRQIVGNLIKNALRFRTERMLVKCFGGDKELTVEVSDDGPGIAPEHHAAVFEPYTQVGAGASAGRRGHGVGLAGAQILARRLGGEITLSSQMGQGSVFRLTVPIRRTPDRA